MPNTDRRKMLRIGLAFMALPGSILHFGRTPKLDAASGSRERLPNLEPTTSEGPADPPEQENPMKIHYLEIVTADVDAACETYSKLHGVTFGEADASLGNARTAKLTDGGLLGIRAPMHGAEKAVVRPYILVKDIDAAVAAADKSGAKIAVPPMKIEGHGTCAIFIQHGIESGLWQN